MFNLIKKIFLKQKKQVESDHNLMIMYLIYNKQTNTVTAHVDYDAILEKYEEPIIDDSELIHKPVNSVDISEMQKDAEHLANFLYSICNIKYLLPSIVLEDLNHNKDKSLSHTLFINNVLFFLEDVLIKSKPSKNQSKQPLIKPSKVFKNG